MRYDELLTQLLPPVAYDSAGTQVRAEARWEAGALQTVRSYSHQVASAVSVATAGDMLADFERVYGLLPADTYSDRVGAVLAKINATGGLSIPYFIDLAAAYGLAVDIDEPQPFRAGVNTAGDTLWDAESVFLWRVNIFRGDVGLSHFRAGQSGAGERLLQFVGSPCFELFEELKPAHTKCIFINKTKK